MQDGNQETAYVMVSSSSELERLTNVCVAVADALETGLPRASFDLVHERLQLTNVSNAEAVVTEMIALTRPGSFIAPSGLYRALALRPPQASRAGERRASGVPGALAVGRFLLDEDSHLCGYPP